jgi:hypothetical protein
MKLDDYMAIEGANRAKFWEEPSTRNVMELISKNKLDMKNAAELLGVSYTLLYSKYREIYGYLKHPHLGKMKSEPSPQNAQSSLSTSSFNNSAQLNRLPRKRNSIDWGNENVQKVCQLISSRQISIKVKFYGILMIFFEIFMTDFSFPERK